MSNNYGSTKNKKNAAIDSFDDIDDIVAVEDRELDKDIVVKNSELYEMQSSMAEMQEALIRLQTKPLAYATVVQPDGEFILDAFQPGDHVLILEPKLKKKGYRYGTIAEFDQKTGVARINTGIFGENNAPISFNLNVGLNNQPVQFKLVAKNDGKNVVISYQNDQFEVHGLPSKRVEIGDCVKIDVESKQIVDVAGTSGSGTICYVKTVIDDKHVEVEVNGASRVVIIGLVDKDIKPGSKGVLDRGEVVLIKVLDDHEADEYSVSESLNVSWDDVAGLEDAKQVFAETIKLPYKFPEIYKYYNHKAPKGIMMYGPPGCGKTLCGKAAATDLAEMHGQKSMATGFVFIKGPELLSKYVGESEAKIRNLFERGRRHYEKNGYPALIFIDEADAIMPARGSGISSDVEKTIVPMFLSEMDGLESSHSIVVLATNKPDALDPAVTREGRIDQKIKINRPTIDNAPIYFRINMKKVPLARGVDLEELIDIAVKCLFAPEKAMYEIKESAKHDMICLADCVNGAMIAHLVQSAVQLAISRDLKSGKRSGVTPTDFLDAIERLYRQHLSINHEFDIQDFCERNEFDRKKATVTKTSLQFRNALNKVKG